MRAAPKIHFGMDLLAFRKRMGLTPHKLAFYLNVTSLLIKDLEAGRSEPPRDPAFYQRFRDVPGCTEWDIICLLHTAEVDKYSVTFLERIIGLYREFADYLHLRFPHIGSRSYDIIQSHNASTVKDRDPLPSQPTDPQPQGESSTRQGNNTPELGLEQPSLTELARQAASPENEGRRRRGVVYEKTRSHYDREFIQENAENVVGLVVRATGTNDPALSQAAEQTLQSMHRVAEAVAKKEGTSISQASRKINVPLNRIADYVRKNLIPVLYKDKGTTYLANSTLEELGRDYQDALEMGMQPARLLRERHDKYFPPAPKR